MTSELRSKASVIRTLPRRHFHIRDVMSLLALVDNHNFPPRASGLHVPNGRSGAAEGEGPITDRNELASMVQGAQDIQIRS